MYKEKDVWHIANIADLEAVQITQTKFINQILNQPKKKEASIGKYIIESTTPKLKLLGLPIQPQ